MAFVANQSCKLCGRPAAEARVELDGTLTFLCEQHSAPLDSPLEDARKQADASEDRDDPPDDGLRPVGSSHPSR